MFKSYAQIPYFAGTVGKDRVYCYTSLKVSLGIKPFESYNVFQYGLSNNIAIGADLSVSGSGSYYGYLVRYGKKINKFINIGAQVTPSHNLSDKFKFEYLTLACYLNGAISPNEKLFWVANTWYTINRKIHNTVTQWCYIGYNFTINSNHKLTPMIGCIYSWLFDISPDLATGFYYNYKKFNFYLWCDKIFEKHHRIVIGVDLTI